MLVCEPAPTRRPTSVRQPQGPMARPARVRRLAGGGLDASGTVNGVGRVVGGVRDTGRAMGSTAVQTGKRVKGAAQANADARLQSELLRAN